MSWTTSFAIAMVGALCSYAHAGPLEVLRDIAFHPTDPRTFAAVYSAAGGGVLITRDGGASFELLCSAAVHGQTALGSAAPMVSFTADGHLLYASPEGLFRDDGSGCGFVAVADLKEQRISELYADPYDATPHYALTSTGGALNGVFRSIDNGLTWHALTVPEEGFFRGIRVIKLADGRLRTYLSVCTPDPEGSTVSCALRISNDDLETVQIEEFANAQDLRVVGVDALDPNRVYAVASLADRSRSVLFVNGQAGVATAWRELSELTQLGSFVTPKEGGFWVVDVGKGQLLHGSPESHELEYVEGVPQASCYAVGAFAGQRFVCNSWQLLPIDENGATAGVLLDFHDVSSLVSCGGDDLGMRCEQQLEYGWCSPTHFPAAPICGGRPAPRADAAVPDAGSTDQEDEADAGVRAASGGSGCSLALRLGAPGRIHLVLLLGLLFARRGLRRARLNSTLRRR